MHATKRVKTDKLLAKLSSTDAANRLPKPVTIDYNGHPVNLKLGKIKYFHPRLVGRSSLVVAVTADDDVELSSLRLVLKISFPVVGGHDEGELVQGIHRKLNSFQPKNGPNPHEWVREHLPKIFFHDTQDFGEDRVMARVEAWLNGEDVHWRDKFKYDRRVCRIILQERLRPIQKLRSADALYKVLFDAIQTHRWVYDHVDLLHRDISVRNIMLRRGENRRICAVLNDWDLASYPHDVVGLTHHRARTGTRPFMSVDFHLNPSSPPRHLYRHDLESFVWVLYYMVKECKFHKRGIKFKQHGARDPDDWNAMDDPYFLVKKLLLLQTASESLAALLKEIDPQFSAQVATLLSPLLTGLERGRAAFEYFRAVGKASVDEHTLDGKFTYDLFVETFSKLDSSWVKYRDPRSLRRDLDIVATTSVEQVPDGL